MKLKWNERQRAGMLLFFGASQAIMLMVVSEILYPNYNIATTTISKLGTGQTAWIFNPSITLLGVMTLSASYLLYRSRVDRALCMLIGALGIGLAGVGVFHAQPDSASYVHYFFAGVAFLAGGIGGILAFRTQREPLNYFSVAMGSISLLAMAFFVSRNYLWFGIGGMERLITYPIIFWVMGFGCWLIYCEPSNQKKG